MKINRRRALFYQRRSSNLYRAFALLVLILFGAWFVVRLWRGEVRNPLAPTPTPTRTTHSYAEEGEAFFNAGNLNAAISAYQDAADLAPTDADIWSELARIQTYSSRLLTNDNQRLTRLSEALSSADRAVALAPEDSLALAVRAFVLDWNADPALDSLRTDGRTASDFIFEAEQLAQAAIAQDSNNALALAFLAEIQVDQQKWSQAEQNILRALQLGPGIMDVRRVYAQYLESIGDYRQAIEEYQAALEISPNLTFLYISIGVNYRTLAFRATIPSTQAELYNSAIENFAKAARINEQLGIQDPFPFLAIAKAYAQQGEFFAAALNAQKAIELDPTNADLYGQLGNIYKRGRNFETAIIALKCAVRGCTPVESCQARNGCAPGDLGVQVVGLQLTSNTASYYLDYGSVLSAWPAKEGYCAEAEAVLTELKNAFPTDDIIVRNVNANLAVCATEARIQTQTITPGPTPVYSTPVP
jgi:tetratricopeptide (TPR) repeat protein